MNYECFNVLLHGRDGSVRKMLSLPLDIKLEIATKDPEVWYLIYCNDPEFAQLAQGDYYISRYIDLFTKVEKGHDDEGSYTLTLLFGLGNSIRGLPARVYDAGEQYWMLNGLIHRGNDLPALLYKNGDKVWCWHGKIHRDGDKPAFKRTFAKAWFQHGKCHRDNDLYAIARSDGKKEWFQHGLRHREGDKPAVIHNRPAFVNEYWKNDQKYVP